MRTATPQDTKAQRRLPLPIAERIVAVVLMAAIIFLHLYNHAHAGALWRDEANSLGLATMPTLSELWQNFQFDSVPFVWISVLRVLHALGVNSDAALRTVGLGVGLGLLGVFWLNAHQMNCGIPVVSLALVGLSPTIIRWGDCLRAYGLGLALMLCTFGLVWKVATSSRRTTFLLATAAAVCSVHTLYYNAVLLFAICSAGALLAASHRQWKRSALVLLIGLIAAVSMLVYADPLRREHEWYVVVLPPSVEFATLLTRLHEALSASGGLMAWIWAAAYGALIAVTVVCLLRPKVLRATREQRDLAIYAFATALISVVAYAMFLKRLNYIPFPWYYVALMALTAASMDAGFSVLRNVPAIRTVQVAASLCVLVLTFFKATEPLKLRLTNVDLIAEALNASAGDSDYVIVDPWFAGITFQRYYRGLAVWSTLPPIENHRVHRYDKLKEMMSRAEPVEAVRPILKTIASTLKSGHKLWLVGYPAFVPPGQAAPSLPPAPYGSMGWYSPPYQQMWSLKVGEFIQTHALRATHVEVPTLGGVSNYENLPLVTIEGWH